MAERPVIGRLPDVRPTWADAIAAIKVGQQPLMDMIEYLVAERSELLAEVERLRIDVHGCGCPAPYDTCPHDEPLARAVGRLTVQVGRADLDREKARFRTAQLSDALRHIADGEQCDNFTRSRCRDPHSGRTRDAKYGADRWCDVCIALDALDALGLPRVLPVVRTHSVRRANRNGAPVWVCDECDEAWPNDSTPEQPWVLERQPCGTRKEQSDG